LILFFGEKRLNKILIYLVSFSVGALLGGTFFHLLPETTEEAGFNVRVGCYLLSGILIYFILEKFIRWRHCHTLPDESHPHPFSYLILFGDGLHNFIDGLIIGASYFVSIPLGIATTLAVIFHEIPQELGDFASLLYGGFTRFKALFFNFLSALGAFLGALIFLFLSDKIVGLTGFLIPFAAGNFIYIASSDLIPELHKELGIKKSIFQFIFLIAGLTMLILI
jgi:zinc and cadmium transporter